MDGRVCSAGGCVCPVNDCSGVCTDFLWDEANCGGCDNVCAADVPYCNEGVCGTCEDAGLTNCGGVCIDTNADDANCGGCDIACDAGSTCSAGVCITGDCDLDCGVGLICCNSEWGEECFDPNNDGANCGGCGTMCPELHYCASGLCECGWGDGGVIEPGGGADGRGDGCQPMECDGVCLDTCYDAANCGDCGAACAAGETCDWGTCMACADLGLTDCGGECAELDWSDAHCGDCATSCAAGEACVSGACVPGDGAGCLADCDASDGLVCCAGSDECIELRWDFLNCGACGNACADGEFCDNGECWGGFGI
jgi:hypothetical protein